MIAFLKYLKGYVKIKVWGFSPERFMNLCSNKNILLWDIKKDGDVYYMSISLQAFYKLRPIVKKTGTKAVILQRCGLPFLVPKVLSRKIFVLGLLACILFWMWSERFIWDILFTGNYTITEDIFTDFLEEQGVHVGMSKKELDIGGLEKAIRQDFDVVTWTSARLVGTKLEIVIKENEKPDMGKKEESFPCSDLVAEFEGVVESIIVRSGVPRVKIGQEVAMGDVLVSGSVPVYNEDATIRKYQYTRSDADIYIRHSEPVDETLPYDYEKKVYTGREKKKKYIQLGEKEYALSLQEITYPYYDTVTDKKQLKLLKGLALPISFGEFTYREYMKEERSYTLEEAENLLKEKYAKFLKGLEEKGVQIIEKNVKIDTSGSMWVLRGELQVIEKAGEEVEVPVAAEETQAAEQQEGMEEQNIQEAD